MYSWGTRVFGQLGHGDDKSDSAENEHDRSEDDPDDIQTVGQSDDSNQDVHHESAGDGADNGGERHSYTALVVVDRVPRVISALAADRINSVAVGNHFVVAVSAMGFVFSWGRGCCGQLGHGYTESLGIPTRIEALTPFVAVNVAAGHSHCLGIFISRQEAANARSKSPQTTTTADYSLVFAWGRGLRGCLGLGGDKNQCVPREVTFFRGLSARHAAAGSDHSLVLCEVGGAQTFLYAFGGNQFGQLGIADLETQAEMPTLVDELVGTTIVGVGAGSAYSAALTGVWLDWGDRRWSSAVD